jgi:hypothetical protein
MVPEGRKAIGTLTPSPEDAKKEENGADDLADATHSVKVLLRTDSHELQQDVPPGAESADIERSSETCWAGSYHSFQSSKPASSPWAATT